MCCCQHLLESYEKDCKKLSEKICTGESKRMEKHLLIRVCFAFSIKGKIYILKKKMKQNIHPTSVGRSQTNSFYLCKYHENLMKASLAYSNSENFRNSSKRFE